jgi:hypothetical protein
MTLGTKAIDKSVAIGSLWIEKRPRKRVFRVTQVIERQCDVQINGTPAFHQPRQRLEEAWGLDEFLKKHVPYTE